MSKIIKIKSNDEGRNNDKGIRYNLAGDKGKMIDVIRRVKPKPVLPFRRKILRHQFHPERLYSFWRDQHIILVYSAFDVIHKRYVSLESMIPID